MHAFRLGKAQRPTYEPREPRAAIDGFALHFLCLGLAYFVLLGVEMSLLGRPAIGITPRDAKRFQQGCQLAQDRILPSPKERVVLHRSLNLSDFVVG